MSRRKMRIFKRLKVETEMSKSRDAEKLANRIDGLLGNPKEIVAQSPRLPRNHSGLSMICLSRQPPARPAASISKDAGSVSPSPLHRMEGRGPG